MHKRKLKVGQHVGAWVSKANQLIVVINRTLKFKSKYAMVSLFKSMVRPHLEYAMQVWSPHLLGDIRLIEVFREGSLD